MNQFPERDLQIFEMLGIGIPNQVVRQQQRVPNFMPNQVVRQQQRVPNFNQVVIPRNIGFRMPNQVVNNNNNNIVRQQQNHNQVENHLARQRVHQEPMDIDDDRMDIDSPKKRKSPKRKVVKRKSPKRKVVKRKSPKRKSPKRKVVKRKSPKRRVTRK